jgi:hypothetical protein
LKKREVVAMVQVMSREDPIKLKKTIENVEIEEAERKI